MQTSKSLLSEVPGAIQVQVLYGPRLYGPRIVVRNTKNLEYEGPTTVREVSDFSIL